MKNMMRKNQMIITALAIMIAVAGYLNFTGTKFEKEENAAIVEESMPLEEVIQETSAAVSAEDTDIAASDESEDAIAADISDEDMYLAEELQGDIESLDSDAEQAQADPALTEEPGEAVFTSTMTGAGIASNAKLLKEQTRAKNKETMLEVINSAAVTDVQKQEAINMMISMVDIAERETAAEVLLSAKGFTDVVVSITEGTADVLVNAYEVSDAQRAQIEDVIKRKTGIPPENLIITPIESYE